MVRNAKVKNPIRQRVGLESIKRRWDREDGKLPRDVVRERLLQLPTDTFVLLDRELLAEETGVDLWTFNKLVRDAVRDGILEPKVRGTDTIGRQLKSKRYRRIPTARAEEVA